MRRAAFLILLILVTACSAAAPAPAITPAVTVEQPLKAAASPQPTSTSTATRSPDPAAEPEPASLATAAATATATTAATASPAPANEALAIESSAAEEMDDAAKFETPPPVRDDVRLATAFGRVAGPLATPTAASEPAVGDVETFYVGNVDSNTVHQITAELRSIGDHAYFWFDQGPGGGEPNDAFLAEATATFDEIYDTVSRYFGNDGAHQRLHILHASPLTICDVGPDSLDSCSIAGYFSQRDNLPRSVNPQSNERPMFVMNGRNFGTSFYLNVLGHELRHALEAGYDPADQDWVVEGTATLAEDLLGYPLSPQARASAFLVDPDQQLTTWSESNPYPHYGQGYLLNRYLLDRLGEEAFQEVMTHEADGLAAVDAVAERRGWDLTGEGLWLDWLAAMALIGEPDVPEHLQWHGPDLSPAMTTAVDSIPASYETTVSQYAADYYALPSSGTHTVNFEGALTTPLLEAQPLSGDRMWYAQRANYSNPRLTRSLDLRAVNAATLEYSVYADIELGYDFAYVSVSTDGGDTWEALTAEHMQGMAETDDPSDSAFAGRFYSGRNRRWVDETIDLTPFAGQEVQVRFEYVTDPILTYGGFALDDIAVPEIGFFDDAEIDVGGWVAEGFLRAPANVPQRWHLQLVTLVDDEVVVEPVRVDATGRATIEVRSVAGETRPLLIVAATAPETLEVADYTLAIR